MRRIIPPLFLVLVLSLPLPPLFTRGACTAEFDAESAAFASIKGELLTLRAAGAYLSAHQMPYATVSPERCEEAPPRDVEICPGGPILLLSVPVKNRICRYYRDPTIRHQLGFNHSEQLVHIQTDMNPFHFRKLPFLDFELDWAK